MANVELQAAVQALCDALIDSAALIKSASLANAEAAGEALLADSDLKLQIGALVLGGLAAIKAAASDLSNISDDLAAVVAAVPLIEKVIAAL